MGDWRMPAEWEPHERTWMSWPSAGYTLGDSAEDAEEARRTWAAVANAVAEHEPLTMLVPPSERAAAGRYLSGAIEVRELELDDAWFRDNGPTFVRPADGTAGLAAVAWVFTGWGRQSWARWELDAQAAPVVAEWAGVPRVDSPMANEGGGIAVDGEGTVIVTETVQLDPDRNPGWSRQRVEQELARTIGARRVIWLPAGLARDSGTYGTKGHVDLVAAFPRPGRVLVHDQRDPQHPDVGLSRRVREQLAGETDAAGRPLEVVPLPAPAILRDADGFVDYSYVNHYVLNGAVIACAFGDPADDRAAGILAEQYPGRTIVPVDARPLFARGGGIHCITQQQPLASPAPDTP